MRTGKMFRTTKETKITSEITIEGKGIASSDTKIGFFDHMINTFAKHSGFNITLKCEGDLFIDTHHTVEDCGICLGSSLAEALEGSTIARYYSTTMCMDDALVICSIDICGRPYFMMDHTFSVEKVGELETETVSEFFKSFSDNAKMNLHFVVLRGENNHHIIECMFKAFAFCLKNACKESNELLSTKGVL